MIRNNNQNGRRRGRGGARPPQGGGPSGNYGNANGGGSRIDTRQRGNATQLLEKYKAMARDATQNGDRVQAEFYMQYADHYYRVLNEFRARDPQPAPRQNYDEDDGFDNMGGVGQNYAASQTASYADDGDDEEEGDDARRQAVAPPERPSYDRSNERQQGDRQQGDRQQGDRQQGDRQADRNRNGANPSHQQRAYNGQRDGNQSRDGSQQPNNGQGREAYAPREAAMRDQQQGDYAPRGNGQGDTAPRETFQRETSVRDNGQRDGQQREAAVRDNAQPDNVEREPRAEAPRSRERMREPIRRSAEPVETMIAGLPGPATLAPLSPAPAPQAVAPAAAVEPEIAPDAADAPVKRPRGRPRKVVAPVTDAADA